jgi:acetyltransferase-like isoleucine patch superfamily enzyme
MSDTYADRIAQARREPRKALRVLAEKLRGGWVRLRCKLLGKRITFGRDFRVMPGGRLHVRGPGRVVFGDHVCIWDTVTPWTDTAEAVITIGNRVTLNGTRFGCHRSIRIGDGSLIGDCRMMDSDYHGTDPRARERYEVAPIVVGENVWITMQCVVLKGVTIGSGSTVAIGSVVTRDLPENSVCGGNPAVFLRSALPDRPGAPA